MQRVSVIIPTYKRASQLERAIGSVLIQDYPATEIIVVDDNGKGTDQQKSTEALLARYIDAGQLRYIANETNLGGGPARNAGIEASTGDLITFLDDDDEYPAGKLTAEVAEMERSGLDVCIMEGETYNANGDLVSRKIQYIDTGMSQEELLREHLTRHITGTNGFMYRREALFRIGMFDDISAGQEYMLMLKTITGGLKIGCLHQTGYIVHVDGLERISTRLSKISGLERIFCEKKKHFSLLNRKERARIRARHHATLFYVYFSNKKYGKAFGELLKAFFSSPKHTFQLFLKQKKRLSSL